MKIQNKKKQKSRQQKNNLEDNTKLDDMPEDKEIETVGKDKLKNVPVPNDKVDVEETKDRQEKELDYVVAKDAEDSQFENNEILENEIEF